MKFEEIFKYTYKSVGREIGLDVKYVNGKMVCTPLDPDDPRYNVDMTMPSMPMVYLCRADEFDFFQPLIDDGVLTIDQMHRATERYLLGKTKSGIPMFWMIDHRGQPLDAHISEGWISQILKKRESLLEYWQVRHCLFGEHLLAGNSNSVAIVESERTAVILSELLPESIWLAYAYPNNITPLLMAPLQGRTVTIFPYTDPYLSNFLYFQDFIGQVRRLYDINLHIDTTLEDHATESQKSRCIDILDFILEI